MELVSVRSEDRELLWNIIQKYLYEMTNYYDDVMDELGNPHYRYFDAYFSDPERKAFFLYENRVPVGFALIHPYSELGKKTDHVLAEFTVFPMYRGKGIAAEAAKSIFERFKGEWEIKYNEKNRAAKAFWNKVTKTYEPKMTSLNEAETVLSFRST